MLLPSEPVTLSVEQVAELNRKLADMRHDINNQLTFIVAAVELMRYKPETAERMMATLSDQPSKIAAVLTKFSAEFERAFGITRPLATPGSTLLASPS
jgi:signal transduction histidine kinase